MRTALTVIALLGVSAMSHRINLKQRSASSMEVTGKPKTVSTPRISGHGRKLAGTTKADLCDLVNTRWASSTKDFQEFGQSLGGSKFTD